jgi:hypothetical protein
VSHLCVRAYLFNGTTMLSDALTGVGSEADTILPVSSAPRWLTAPLVFSANKQQDVVTLSSLPRTARLCFLLIGKSASSGSEFMLAWQVLQLVDEAGVLVSGRQTLRMWSMDAHKKGKHGKVRRISTISEASTVHLHL